MQDLEMKKSILKEIMDMMDAREGEGLKKHPKLAAKAEVPMSEEEAMSLESEEKPEMMEEAKPEMASDEIDPEDLERLMELHRTLKA
jgi:hypothetical protein